MFDEFNLIDMIFFGCASYAVYYFIVRNLVNYLFGANKETVYTLEEFEHALIVQLNAFKQYVYEERKVRMNAYKNDEINIGKRYGYDFNSITDMRTKATIIEDIVAYEICLENYNNLDHKSKNNIAHGGVILITMGLYAQDLSMITTKLNAQYTYTTCTRQETL